MQRRPHISSILSLFLSVSAAHATMLVNPPPPFPQANMGDTGFNIIYPANNGAALPGGAVVNTAQGYRFVDLTNQTADTSLIYIDVTSTQTFNSTNGQRIVVTLSANTTDGSNSEIPLVGAGIVSGEQDAPPLCSTFGTCQGGTGTNLSAAYSNGQRVRLSFSLADLCSVSALSSNPICANRGSMTQVNAPQTLTQVIYVTIGQASPTAPWIGPLSTSSASGGTIEQTTFTLQITNTSPILTVCPNTSEADFYFPGDGQVYLTPGNFGPSANGGVSLQSMVFLGQLVSVGSVDPLPTGLSSSSIKGYPVISGRQPITGFVNDQDYNVAVYVQNNAGIVGGYNGGACSPNGFAVRSRAIQGVLAESKCFIATAAYQDGRAAPVMLLRRFRDQILSRFEIGKKFIDVYYTYSPPLAEWAWDKPIIRSIALRALGPVEFFAWAWLKLAHAQTAPKNESPQPYLDRLKKQIEEEDQKNGNLFRESDVSYTEQEKKKLPLGPANPESYTERLKKVIPPEESSQGHTEKEKTALPPETAVESPTELVKSGRDRKLGRGPKKEINNAVGFKLGISPGMSVTVSGGPHPYEAVYDSTWKPDFYLHFEHQFVHSEDFGSFAASADVGVNYAAKYGLFNSDFPTGSGNNTSITQFTFLQIPLIFSAIYRFNLARIIRPYVSAGVGSIFYFEIRDDNVNSNKGYSLVYSTSVGLSLLLDFFDRKTSTDSYLATGIQHTYLSVEYMYLNTFSTDVVFKRGGIYAGFLFEI